MRRRVGGHTGGWAGGRAGGRAEGRVGGAATDLGNLAHRRPSLSRSTVQIRQHLPVRLWITSTWTAIFSTYAHGMSLHTLMERAHGYNGPTLLVVRDKAGAVRAMPRAHTIDALGISRGAGGWGDDACRRRLAASARRHGRPTPCSTARARGANPGSAALGWARSPSGLTRERRAAGRRPWAASFVWKLLPNGALRVYPWSRVNDYFMIASVVRHESYLAMGGGYVRRRRRPQARNRCPAERVFDSPPHRARVLQGRPLRAVAGRRAPARALVAVAHLPQRAPGVVGGL